MVTGGGNDSFLLGPNLLLGMCLQAKNALAWSENVPASHCFISRLAIVIGQSVIERDCTHARRRNQWLNTLQTLENRYVLAGGMVVDVSTPIIDRWLDWRLCEPLQFEAQGQRFAVDQDVRLILATADALSLTYVEYDAPYLGQAAAQGLSVQAVPCEA